MVTHAANYITNNKSACPVLVLPFFHKKKPMTIHLILLVKFVHIMMGLTVWMITIDFTHLLT